KRSRSKVVAAVCALLITMSAVGAHPREAEAARPAAAPEVFASNNDSLLVADLDETIRFVCDASRAERGPWRSTTGDRVSRAGAIARRASTPGPSDRRRNTLDRRQLSPTPGKCLRTERGKRRDQPHHRPARHCVGFKRFLPGPQRLSARLAA